MPLNHRENIKYISTCNRCNRTELLESTCYINNYLNRVKLMEINFLNSKNGTNYNYNYSSDNNLNQVNCNHDNCKLCICGGNCVIKSIS